MPDAEKHTPTPWHVATSGEITDWPEKRVEAAEETVALVYYHQIPNGEAIQQANARRIVAAVNFCEGIETDRLEFSTMGASGLEKAVSVLADRRDDLEAENERLKERLANLENLRKAKAGV
jgi:hypothetical protein